VRKNHHIQDLILQGESQTLDFKFEIADSKKIARTLAAFANTDGGTLLIGVKDNGAIAGVRSDEEYYMLEAAAKIHCRPAIDFTVEKWTIEGKTVLEVSIKKDMENLPHMAPGKNGRWMAYIRSHDQTILANGVLMKVWRNKYKNEGVLLEFSRIEKILLAHLEKNGQITHSRFCKIAGISWKHAEDVLASLICMNILNIALSEKETLYFLHDEFQEKVNLHIS